MTSRQSGQSTETDADSRSIASTLLRIRSSRPSDKTRLPSGDSHTFRSGQTIDPAIVPPRMLFPEDSSTCSGSLTNERATRPTSSTRTMPSPTPMQPGTPSMCALSTGGSETRSGATLSSGQLVNWNGRTLPSPALPLLRTWDGWGNLPLTGTVSNTTMIPLTVSSRPRDSVESPDGGSRSDSLIRKEQVEAALRSKPQRGRKRENLSEHERLELTRTRNREHAKITRLRKKARYLELLEEERQLQEYQRKARLDQDRRKAVSMFITARKNMLLRLRPSETSGCSGDTPHADNTWLSPIQDLVEDMAHFGFEAGNLPVDETTTAAERMACVDEHLLTRIVRQFGTGMLSLIEYNLVRGAAGVALDSAQGGVAEISVTLEILPKVNLAHGFLCFSFAGPDSCKLSSVCWRPVKDSFCDPAERLIQQVSHPSVVSLDPAIANDPSPAPRDSCIGKTRDRTWNEDTGGPGMNI